MNNPDIFALIEPIMKEINAIVEKDKNILIEYVESSSLSEFNKAYEHWQDKNGLTIYSKLDDFLSSTRLQDIQDLHDYGPKQFMEENVTRAQLSLSIVQDALQLFTKRKISEEEFNEYRSDGSDVFRQLYSLLKVIKIKNDESMMVNKGGIDLNQDYLDFQTQGNTVDMSMFTDSMQNIHIENGLVPTINSITPVINLQLLFTKSQGQKEPLPDVSFFEQYRNKYFVRLDQFQVEESI